MTTRLLISSFLLLTGLCSVGQNNLSINVFHKHTQLCHVIGTTEKDFVMELFGDSTIKISEYTSNYIDEYRSVLRYTYYGTYSVKNDTLRVRYLTHKVELKNKSQNKNGISRTKPSDSFYIYPPNAYILNKEIITSTDDSFLELKKSRLTKANELELKFNNWDNPSSFKREVFGVTKN